ncbi:hypothetical protein Rhopal_004302-T1 [Rhodotorula paludigena]|uniref:Uncharacterized protein n=1 Tax=Rhodotorula paludigena TaxID=86838 RepID=A0AAV5GRH0_9BASI|nr:hypothetical protein Rhopal_004302-T1 [Rhodotorula paludigena]
MSHEDGRELDVLPSAETRLHNLMRRAGLAVPPGAYIVTLAVLLEPNEDEVDAPLRRKHDTLVDDGTVPVFEIGINQLMRLKPSANNGVPTAPVKPLLSRALTFWSWVHWWEVWPATGKVPHFEQHDSWLVWYSNAGRSDQVVASRLEKYPDRAFAHRKERDAFVTAHQPPFLDPTRFLGQLAWTWTGEDYILFDADHVLPEFHILGLLQGGDKRTATVLAYPFLYYLAAERVKQQNAKEEREHERNGRGKEIKRLSPPEPRIFGCQASVETWEHIRRNLRRTLHAANPLKKRK